MLSNSMSFSCFHSRFSRVFSRALSSGHHFSQPICDLIVDCAFTRAHSSNVCMLSSHSEANNWLRFIVKHPCCRVRVLEEDQCPPFGIDHDIRDYPAYYDPLYYPQFHASKFENARSFCCWLSEALTNHSQDCSRCLGWPLSNCVVTYDGVGVSISCKFIDLSCSLCYFESESYIHCDLVNRLQVQSHSCSDGFSAFFHRCVNDLPHWMYYSDNVLRNRLALFSNEVLLRTIKQFGERSSLKRSSVKRS